MELFNYLLKVTACSALLFAFYLLVLRKLTFFRINRFYLLTSVLVSFLIPSLQFTIEREVVPVAEMASQEILPQQLQLNPTTLAPPASVDPMPIQPKPEAFDGIWLMAYVYVSIVVCLLLFAMARVWQLVKHTNAPIKEFNGLKLVAKNEGFTNCSFFNYVFINENSLAGTALDALLAHEQVHAKQYHSVDKLLLIVAKAVLWFNPIIYLYDKALEEVHEFEADEMTSQHVGTQTYAALLLRLAVSKNDNPLIHNFVKSPIKQRIKMLFSSKSKKMKKLAYLLALPIGLGLLWGFTVDIVKVVQEKEFTLVIDAGHGGKKSGATVNGVSEKDIALSLSKKIKALADQKGIKVITTRAIDKDVSMEDRAKADGSFLLSLHVNSEPKGTTANGIEMFTSPSGDQLKSTRSMSMTYNLYQSLKNIEGISTSNKPKQAGLLLLKNTKLPAVLLEIGYLTNTKDFKFLTNAQKQNELANAIIEAVLNYKKNSRTDSEMKAMIKVSETVSDEYLTWKKSKAYKLILEKAAKIKSTTLKGKIESLNYFSTEQVLDGFILNANGERYRVYLTKDQLKQFNVEVGKSVSVRATQVEAWHDSNYPVIKTSEILAVAAAKVDAKPSLVNSSTATAKWNYSAEDSTITSKNKETVKLYGNARVNFVDHVLKGKIIEINNITKLLTAHNAVLTGTDGSIVRADVIKYDALKNQYIAIRAAGKN